MRLTVTIMDMSAEEFDFAQRNILTSYEFGQDTPRVCLTLVSGGQERHADMPLTAYHSLMGGFVYRRVAENLGKLLRAAFARSSS